MPRTSTIDLIQANGYVTAHRLVADDRHGRLIAEAALARQLADSITLAGSAKPRRRRPYALLLGRIVVSPLQAIGRMVTLARQPLGTSPAEPRNVE